MMQKQADSKQDAFAEKERLWQQRLDDEKERHRDALDESRSRAREWETFRRNAAARDVSYLWDDLCAFGFAFGTSKPVSPEQAQLAPGGQNMCDVCVALPLPGLLTPYAYLPRPG